MRVKLSTIQKNQLEESARKAGFLFVRIFGSSTDPKRQRSARDVDLVVGPPTSSLARLARFQSDMEQLFKKDVDVVVLKSGISPQLVLEIGSHSQSLWEDKETGLACYAEWMDRLHAIAQDEVLAFPPRMQKEALRAVQKRLRDVS